MKSKDTANIIIIYMLCSSYLNCFQGRKRNKSGLK
ncbi:unnamed protein product [Paramecium sonneborni]|uniref:Uncharacterized protein n=1 Tax=Paramecium sonneborni TaxID=65129 RepID=A0A8S1RA72_9CILI|nr:unnamed protein product [Paramecium sonneborni]